MWRSPKPNAPGKTSYLNQFLEPEGPTYCACSLHIQVQHLSKLAAISGVLECVKTYCQMQLFAKTQAVKYGLGKIDCGSKVNMLIIENNCLRKFTNLSSLIDMEMLNLVDLRELLASQYPGVMCCCTKAYVYRLKNKNKKRKSALRFHPILPVRRFLHFY